MLSKAVMLVYLCNSLSSVINLTMEKRRLKWYMLYL